MTDDTTFLDVLHTNWLGVGIAPFVKSQGACSTGGSATASGQVLPLNSNNWASAIVTFETVR